MQATQAVEIKFKLEKKSSWFWTQFFSKFEINFEIQNSKIECREIGREKEEVKKEKKSLRRNGNSKENLNANSKETTNGTKVNSNHDNNSEEKLFKQPSRGGNRKKRELNYLKVDDVDIDFKGGNVPTINFKIEVNLSTVLPRIVSALE